MHTSLELHVIQLSEHEEQALLKMNLPSGQSHFDDLKINGLKHREQDVYDTQLLQRA